MRKLTNPTPTNDKIYVKDAPKQAVVGEDSLIVTPEITKYVPDYGEIVKVNENSKFKVGDLVIYSQYTGTMIQLNGQDIRVISEEDVLGVQE